ncbi:MAG: mitochondrial import receptor protein [Pycnora praestabilis]|nr:MAG: mitochondrial import receptor protein [Pycnora praestabilis]
MVQLKEVEDEHFAQEQPGPEILDNDDDYYTDTDSEISIESSDEPPSESLTDRLSALIDILPPKQRATLLSTFSTTTSWLKSGLVFGGKGLWVVSTSALLLGVPWALAFAEEQQVLEMEREMKMQQQAGEVSQIFYRIILCLSGFWWSEAKGGGRVGD